MALTREQITEKFIGIIVPYATNKEQANAITLETHLLNDLKINSAHIIDIVLDAEKEFDITIEDEAIDKLITVGQAVDAITEKLSA